MRGLLGTTAALGLVMVACDAPAPQSIVANKGPEQTASSHNVAPSTGPIILVDGVRMVADTSSFSMPKSEHDSPRDLLKGLSLPKPENIQSIEVVKGKAAARLYGPDAGRGVIVITTTGHKKN